MEISDSLSDDGETVVAGPKNETFRLRSYQAEMVEESLKANIIVAMDTGSGKTHIALARTAAELETCRPDQLVWFLAPTVALCEQQYGVFKSHLPAYNIIFLSGKDNVDHWTDHGIWDAVLSDVRVVLSTHQVLLDALTHAFVKMSKIAMLVFDEAHHCVSNHPANRIMANFYLPLVEAGVGGQLPRILGLSASPVMKAAASGSELEKIEHNLNSIAKTPKVHRSELLRFVHKPELARIMYQVLPAGPHTLPLLDALQTLYRNYDLRADPYVVGLLEKQKAGYDCFTALQKVFASDSTYCKQQLKSLCDKGLAMYDELGPSATQWYLCQCIYRYQKVERQVFEGTVQEEQHLSNMFDTLHIPPEKEPPLMKLDALSPKLKTLIDVLVSEASPEFTGLVFVEQRVWVVVLSEILSIHPRTKDLFNIGTFVGTSASTRRKKNVAELPQPRHQQNTLDEFRAGTKNVILATSVLEEGIDVSSCHLVICFERPKNLKSFVQRRGRARKQQSKYIIFVPEADVSGRSPENWETLEEEMKKAYLSDLRAVKLAEAKESQDEGRTLHYKVSNTGALLTSDNASQHLHHFCSVIGSSPYFDSRPQFLFERTEYGGIIAKVVLPISVDAAVRTAQSNSVWQTERMAKNDAAFQAYKSLHLAGLVNDNLLPHRQEQDIEAAEFQIPDHTPSMVEVSQPFDPWIEVAKQQEQAPRTYYRYLLETSTVGKEPIHMVLYVASSMPTVPDIPLYWNESTIFSVKSTQLPSITLSEQELDYLRSITRQLLLSAFSSKMSVERHDFLWLLVPSELYDPSQNPQGLQQWIENIQGYTPAIELIAQNKLQVSKWGLVIARGDNRKFILQDIELQSTKMTVAGIPIPQLQVIRTPKRRDFLHRPVEGKQEKVNEMYSRTEWLDVDDCIVENLPAIYSIFALFAPSILHKYEICMVADTLRNTILKPVMFEESHLGLLLRAITSSATGESDNYQRLEFLGDCILKFISSVHLMAAHPTWPESYLTGKKGKVVSNGFLARATMSAGLDKFIVTKRFTGLKWAPRYANDVLEYGKSTGSHEPNEPKQPLKPQEKSSKLLADVIESLLGASYIVGGFPKAFTCVQTLLPLESWTSISEANIILYEAAPDDFMPTNLDGLENLIGYPFSKKLLLVQALTHASYNGPNAGYPYERLEFLGDAVLDYIVSTRLYNHSPELSHQTMHSIRTSMVNASFLAFRMFETKLQVTNTNKKTFEEEKVDRVLWQFLRHGEPKLIGARDAALKQHNECRDILLEELQTDGRFPWHLLSLMDAPKFLSDIVESVIGAIYVDSQGSIEACEVFVRRLGILDCLERILTDRVDCLHPKERLGHLAVEKDVRYVKVAPTKDENPATEGSYTVQVKMGGENIGGPVEGLRRLNAETMAAWKACRIIEGLDDVGMRDVDEEASDEEWHDAEEGGGILLEGV